ncbi:MAG TPA: 4'-phosphopantetheinyl transferase superfamily protein [Candidatus Methylacidiphilales bacterium]|jgi:4'-phosphopantetheinyl transferase|nr:4'-phosphopantetheinyl transferase superfamily protein [Candidatus Methylacidiphilales bacterium]
MTTSDREVDPASAVVVWLANVPELQDELAGLEALLDPRERERAESFRFAEDRARFTVGRGLLRHGLRRYAPKVPPAIEMAYSSLGRPLVPAEYEAPRFSISHTRDLVALAFAAGAQAGVDLEYMQPPVDLLELAERILSEEDLHAFVSLPRHERLPAFFRVWTRKEAYLKARGEGIATGLQDVSVSLAAEAVILVTDRRDSSSTAWRLHSLPVPAEYMGCVACDEATRPVSCLSVRMEKREVRLEPTG